MSSQELLDCDVGFNSGCSGGNPAVAYEYIQNYGLTSSSSLPYKGYQQHCYRNDINQEIDTSSSSTSSSSTLLSSFYQPKPIATIAKYLILPSRNEFILKEYVNTIGPISVGICGTDPRFIYYGGGIFNVPDCCVDLNHAVVIVGYGKHSFSSSSTTATTITSLFADCLFCRD